MAVLTQTCGALWLELEWYNCVCTYFPQYILPAIYYMGTYELKGTHLLMALDGFFPLWIYWVEHMYMHYFPTLTCGVMGKIKASFCFLLSDSFLASLTCCPTLCFVRSCALPPSLHLPVAPMGWKIPALVLCAIPFPAGEAQVYYWFWTKTLPEGTWCCSQSGLGFKCCRFGRLELQLFSLASRVG